MADDRLNLLGQKLWRGIEVEVGAAEFRHLAAQTLAALHQHHSVARVGNVQRSLHAGDAPADDQRPLGDGQRQHVQWLVSLHLLHDGLDDGDGLGRGLGRIILMHPGTLFADVGALAQVGVEAHRGHGAAEGGLVHGWRAGGDHYTVESLFLDAVADQLLARFRAAVLVGGGQCDARDSPQCLRHRFHVYSASDVVPAVADENADASQCNPQRVPGCLRDAQVRARKRTAHTERRRTKDERPTSVVGHSSDHKPAS